MNHDPDLREVARVMLNAVEDQNPWRVMLIALAQEPISIYERAYLAGLANSYAGNVPRALVLFRSCTGSDNLFTRQTAAMQAEYVSDLPQTIDTKFMNEVDEVREVLADILEAASVSPSRLSTATGYGVVTLALFPIVERAVAASLFHGEEPSIPETLTANLWDGQVSEQSEGVIGMSRVISIAKELRELLS